MSDTYSLIEDVSGLIETIPEESIVSRTFFRGEHVKGVVFGFDAGQELSEHTSSQRLVVQIIRGEATITVGDDRHELAPGAWMQLPPRLKHSVQAKTPLIMLLLMFGTE
jgi:quercetin dioxygenase-like cupin family protein